MVWALGLDVFFVVVGHCGKFELWGPGAFSPSIISLTEAKMVTQSIISLAEAKVEYAPTQSIISLAEAKVRHVPSLI